MSLINTAADLFSRKDQVSFLVCENEHASPELARLIEWLKTNQWSMKEIDFCVAGSQELITYELTKGSYNAYLLFETYEGVTLYASPSIAEQFHEIQIRK